MSSHTCVVLQIVAKQDKDRNIGELTYLCSGVAVACATRLKHHYRPDALTVAQGRSYRKRTRLRMADQHHIAHLLRKF